MKMNAFANRIAQAAFSCALALAFAAPASARPVTYRLTNDAGYVEGCFELCACPLWFSSLTGRFRLNPISITGTVDTYAITIIHWTIGTTGTPITGQGTLTRFNEFAALNRLELDLTIGSGSATHFDSGMVPAGAPWPRIDITVVEHGAPACYDIRPTVAARPVHADLNADGVVNVDDLLEVVNHWGLCRNDADPCSADIAPEPEGNRAVNVDDLLAVITDWG